MLTARRLPGFYFQPPPPAPELLPRMDVAVFVGFAATGPLHHPVLVEEAAQFAEIFGPDLRLAWDAQRGEAGWAYLGPAVRAFFRNGGRRAWVVRVASAEAERNQFPVPGLRQVTTEGLKPAVAQARSSGSWADTLQVGATLNPTPFACKVLTLTEEQVALQVWANAPTHLTQGDLLRFDMQEVHGLFVVTTTTAPSPALVSQNTERYPLRLSAKNVAWLAGEEEAPVRAPMNLQALALISTGERLTFDLWVRQASGEHMRLRGLGFAPTHPRYWRALPTDEELFPAQPEQPPLVTPYAALWQEVAHPRFMLAGAGPATALYVPSGMSMDRTQFNGPEPSPFLALARDGLAQLDARLFLDQHLAAEYVETLLPLADALRYEQPQPITLTGLHAALEVDEATLIAVPDAVHLGWQPVKPPPPELPKDPPPLTQPTASPGCQSAKSGAFLNCHPISAPTLSIDTDPEVIATGAYTLTWQWEEQPAPTQPVVQPIFSLMEATHADAANATLIYQGHQRYCALAGRAPGTYFYWVRVQHGPQTSAWSPGLWVQVPAPVQRPMQYTAAPLLAVQRALLRLCAARGDLLAVLSLPEHYRETQAIQHIQHLQSPHAEAAGGAADERWVPPLSVGEARALSFGALYHPWFFGRDDLTAAAFRRTPPDGAVCGLLARRARERGAWVAPANQAFDQVVALSPTLARAHWPSLQAAQLNTIWQEPRGFMALNANTLSVDPNLCLINVRRLLILLRRLALRVGTNYVFEPHNTDLHLRVQRGFEALLEQLFARGAFAGRVADQAFAVVVNEQLNPSQSMEQGRLIVELKVAPAVPLHFLTLRLVQSQAGTQAEEVV